MKKLGLIGGMGPESTIPYYHGIVYGVQQRTGQKLFPCLTIESVDVFEVLRFCGEERYDELTVYLMKAIHNLEKSGADFAALSANTPHIVFDRLREQSSIPLISIVEAACQEARKRSFKRIGLLGTIFTMQGAFFKKPFVNQGISRHPVPAGKAAGGFAHFFGVGARNQKRENAGRVSGDHSPNEGGRENRSRCVGMHGVAIAPQ